MPRSVETQIARRNERIAAYYEQGRYARAIPIAQRLCAFVKAHLGERHPYYAGSLNNLASLYEAQGRFAEALALYQQALAVYETALGPTSADLAPALNNLGGV
jgi:tetratricopeptide (TPR) repeat protein